MGSSRSRIFQHSRSHRNELTGSKKRAICSTPILEGKRQSWRALHLKRCRQWWHACRSRANWLEYREGSRRKTEVRELIPIRRKSAKKVYYSQATDPKPAMSFVNPRRNQRMPLEVKENDSMSTLEKGSSECIFPARKSWLNVCWLRPPKMEIVSSSESE